MKKGLSLFLSLLMVTSIITSVPVIVNAASRGTCGENLTWVLDDEGTLTISGTGEMTDYSYPLKTPWYDMRSNIKTVVIENGVTSIGNEAFSNFTNLFSINLSDSVTRIGMKAFEKCRNLISVTIPNGVTTIGDSAFSNCVSLSTINLSDSIIDIGETAFYGCNSITSIVIPDKVTNINWGTFQYCSNLREVTIGDSVTNIYGEAFSGCTLLTSVIIPTSVTFIGYRAFYCFYSIKYIFYKGTQIQWSNINIGADNESLNLTKIHYKAIDHSKSDWIIDEYPSENEGGSKHNECTVCGKKLETATIAQLKCSKPELKKIENTTSGVKITWNKESGADKYDVYRKTGSSGKYSKIGTTSKTYYTDKKASSGKKYYYYVKAVNEAGSSSASSSKSILYLADTTLSTPKSTKSGITLKWKKVTGADGYQVYRKTGSGSYSKIATVKGNSKVTYTDKSAKKGKKYTYKIKAYKSKTYSAYSNAKKIKDKY